MDRVLWVGLGGALGSMARYLLATWVLVWAPAGFPWGVLVVNVLGSFAMGLATALSLGASTASPWPIFVTAGLLGGFTTYSAVRPGRRSGSSSAGSPAWRRPTCWGRSSRASGPGSSACSPLACWAALSPAASGAQPVQSRDRSTGQGPGTRRRPASATALEVCACWSP